MKWTKETVPWAVEDKRADKFSEKKDLSKIPRKQRYAGRPALEDLFPHGEGLSKKERNRLIRLACLTHGYPLKEIARVLGLHYTTVSKVINHEKI